MNSITNEFQSDVFQEGKTGVRKESVFAAG